MKLTANLTALIFVREEFFRDYLAAFLENLVRKFVRKKYKKNKERAAD